MLEHSRIYATISCLKHASTDLAELKAQAQETDDPNASRISQARYRVNDALDQLQTLYHELERVPDA